MRHRALSLALVFSGLSLAACSTRHMALPPPASPVTLPYLDLHPGWRLSIVSPLSKNTGNFEFTARGSSSNPNAGSPDDLSMEAKAPESFGYIRTFVALDSAGSRVSFRLVSSERIRNDEIEVIGPPGEIARIFPSAIGYARLLFLTREAEADHDMAVLCAPTEAGLDTLTESVLHSPSKSCTATRNSWCAWVPAGIAIRAEKLLSESPPRWVPAL